MYVTKSLYESFAQYVDVDDRTFFIKSLELAKNNYAHIEDVDKDLIKRHTPVCFASSLSSQKPNENFVQRKVLSSDRARRKFIMIDADFNESQSYESEELRNKLIALSDKYNTPVMIYPTVSYPQKPRFRAVLLVKRGLTPSKYWSAVTWLYRELETEIIDKSDLRLSANRNLPVFCNDDQVSAIFSNFDDDKLQPLDNSLWNGIEAPSKKTLSKEQLEDMKEVQFDEDLLLKGTRQLAEKPIAQSYETFWQIVASVAVSVILEQIDEDLAVEMMEILASAGSSEYQIEEWKRGNVELLQSFISKYSVSEDDIARARPLHSYSEFKDAAQLSGKEMTN